MRHGLVLWIPNWLPKSSSGSVLSMVSNLALEVFGTGSLHGLSATKFTQDPAVWLMRSGGKVRALPTSMLSPLLFQALSLSSPLPPLPDLLSEWPVMSSTSSCEVRALVGCSLASSPLDSLSTPSSSWAHLGAGAGRVGQKVSKN